jgi:hypothetical protein
MNPNPPNSPVPPQIRAALEHERKLLQKRLREVDRQLERMEMLRPADSDESSQASGDGVYLNDALPAALMAHLPATPRYLRSR